MVEEKTRMPGVGMTKLVTLPVATWAYGCPFIAKSVKISAALEAFGAQPCPEGRR